MANSSWTPSVVVGIDFGMTCTGVAFSSDVTGWARPEVIQRWPDRDGRLFGKFPSRIGYNDRGQAVAWGRCNMTQEKIWPKKEFKLFLNRSYCDRVRDSLPHDKAVSYYIDYMTKVCDHVNKTLMARFPRWNERNVEYRFSIPTTWKSPQLTFELKRWLAEAGFVNTATRRVVFSQTEAEAAAIYVAKHYQRGNVIMVVDAGGATTDLNVLKIIEKTPEVTRMEALDKAEGINLGSVMIDTEARQIIVSKLEALHVDHDVGLKWLAEEMMENSGFELFKHNIDTENTYLNLHMEIPTRPGQQIILTAPELKEIFERMVGILVDYIRQKLVLLSDAHAQDRLRYIVLSGGLGSSNYVASRLAAEFCTPGTRPVNAPELQILIAQEPQLAVVKGLVMDRSQAIDKGVSVYSGICCRVSYGVLYTIPYSKDVHFGEPTVRNEMTNTLYAVDQIDWLIKEGTRVKEEGIDKTYKLKIRADQQSELFCVHIVMSELPAPMLPRSRRRGPVTDVCTVEGRFSPDDFFSNDVQLVKKRLFDKHQKHSVMTFKLRIIVGSTDLGFEIVSLDGRRYNHVTERVRVVWNEYQPLAPQERSPPVNESQIFHG